MYAREFEGEAHDFGVIGVDAGTLIMYDEQSGSWWSQLFGEAVDGPMKGQKLDKLPSTMTTWKKWRDLHPDTTVYVKPTIEYRARFTEESFAQIAKSDPRAPIVKEDWVIGVEGHVEARAYLARRLASERLVNDQLEGKPIATYLSTDLATARVWSGVIGERELTFSLAKNEQLLDAETGTFWDPLSGAAVAGPLFGQTLTPVISTYSLWFAWEKYRPDTVVWAGGE